MTPPNPGAKLWLLDFDNTLAALEREVDWPGSRRELEAFLRAEGVEEEIFAEIPKGNLPLYAALHSRWLRAPQAVRAASAIPARAAAPGGAAARIAIPPSAVAANTPIPPPGATARTPATPLGAATSRAVIPTAATPHGAAAVSAGMALARAEALLRRASELIERHELVGAERAAPTSGAIDLLRAIAARSIVAIIVTSNSSRTVAHWLERYRVADLVRAIVGRDSLLALKPSPEMIVRAFDLASPFAAAAATVPAAEALAMAPNRAIARTAIAIADAVFVGDSLADLEAARAAGLGFYGIAATESARGRLIAAGAGAGDLFASPATLLIRLSLAAQASD